MRDQLVAETSTWQNTTLTTDRHSCPRWDFFYWSLIRYNVYNSMSCHLLIPLLLSHDSTSWNPFWLPNVIVCSNLRSPFVSPPFCSLALSLYLCLNSVLHLSSHGVVSGDAFLTSIYGYGCSYLIVRVTLSPTVHRLLHFHCTATTKSTVFACWRDACNPASGFTPVPGGSTASSP